MLTTQTLPLTRKTLPPTRESLSLTREDAEILVRLTCRNLCRDPANRRALGIYGRNYFSTQAVEYAVMLDLSRASASQASRVTKGNKS